MLFLLRLCSQLLLNSHLPHRHHQFQRRHRRRQQEQDIQAKEFPQQEVYLPTQPT
jgi:hypothetical protein